MFDRQRPDVRQGVFETLLVLDGRPVEADAHLARLHASLATLYPHLTPPPLDVPSLMHLYGGPSDGTPAPGSLRVTVAPGPGDRLDAQVARRHMPRETRPSLCSITVPGGLGAHKWADRSLLEEAQARMSVDELPLIVDVDGTALEASRANLFAVRDGILFTPPLDGRILPGVTRMRTLELAASTGIESREARLSRDDLLSAGEVFLTGSVRGIERVRAIDGKALAPKGEIASALAAELRHAWFGTPVG